MKLKNIKSTFRNRIQHGGRSYLTLRLTKDDLGLTKVEFPTVKTICKLLKLEDRGHESGFVDHYYLVDPTQKINNNELSVHLHIESHKLTDERTVDWYVKNLGMPEDVVFEIDKSTNEVYYLCGMSGYMNPRYSVDSNEPYWLFEGTDNEAGRFIYTKDDDEADVRKLLRMFINKKHFEYEFFAGNFFFKLVSGISNTEIKSEMVKSLSDLSNYTKTVYFDYIDNDILITYAIRYKDWVEPFLTDLTKIVKNNRGVNFFRF